MRVANAVTDVTYFRTLANGSVSVYTVLCSNIFYTASTDRLWRRTSEIGLPPVENACVSGPSVKGRPREKHELHGLANVIYHHYTGTQRANETRLCVHAVFVKLSWGGGRMREPGERDIFHHYTAKTPFYIIRAACAVFFFRLFSRLSAYDFSTRNISGIRRPISVRFRNPATEMRPRFVYTVNAAIVLTARVVLLTIQREPKYTGNRCPHDFNDEQSKNVTRHTYSDEDIAGNVLRLRIIYSSTFIISVWIAFRGVDK